MKRYLTILLISCLLLSLTSCNEVDTSTNSQTETGDNIAVADQSHDIVDEIRDDEVTSNLPKQIISYFPNWNLEDKEGTLGGEVGSIAWEDVTFINHAFFEIVPVELPNQTSFDRREENKEARTEFIIKSTNEKFDFEDETESVINPGTKRNHFTQYGLYSERYPDVNIMISIGGWTRCGYFSEMATTKEGRESFITSCLDLIDEYPFIDGIDIDWEYQGGSNDGERLPEDNKDQGCPIWGTPYEDNVNFESLCKELRDALDKKYGIGEKKITACASASTGWTLPNQNWVPIEPYLDYINMMTYDLAGVWDQKTGHASTYQSSAGAFMYLKEKGINPDKINIGTPFYATVFVMDGEIDANRIVGAPIKDIRVPGDLFTMKEIKGYEAEAVSGYKCEIVDGKVTKGEDFDRGGVGWHYAFDDKKQAAYMYNDDPESEFYNYFLSYENSLSLQAKIDAILKYDIAGIIIWESSEDTDNNDMTKQLSSYLLEK